MPTIAQLVNLATRRPSAALLASVTRRLEAPGQPGTAADLAPILARLDALEYVDTDITALAGSAGTGTFEIGTTVDTVTLNWTINKAIGTQSIASPGPGSLDPGLRTWTGTSMGRTTDTTWTLSASDGTTSDSAGLSTLFRHRRRWGVSATETPDAALIDALAGAEFATGRTQSRTLSPVAQYLYFAWPAAWSGSPTFTVNGLAVSGWIKTEVSYTNPSGDTTAFDVWRSPYALTGTFLVTVA